MMASDAVNVLDEIDEPYRFPTKEESAAEDIRVMAGLVPEPAVILDSVEAFLSRFVAYPDKDSLVAHVLWIVHTWSMETWDSTPRLAFLSPEPGSGKTRALEVTSLLVPNALHSVSSTPAYSFRKVSEQENRPTVMYDEIDTLFGPGSTKTVEAEGVRAMINAGHRNGTSSGRCVVHGKTIDTEELASYSAVALAGLGDLPDTLMSRSIVIRMRRRSHTEMVEPFRERDIATEASELSQRLAELAEYIPHELPTLPDGVTDRDADV